MDGIPLFNTFVAAHRPQLVGSGVPEHFWPTLFKKLSKQIFDAGDCFSLLLLDYGDEVRSEEDPVWTVVVSKTEGVNAQDPNAIYLIDHAWTFRLNVARNQLEQNPNLLDRLSIMMGINKEEETQDSCINKVYKNLWKYANTYAINAQGGSVEDRMPIWYIHDELGSGIAHNDEPNFRIVPFIHLEDQTTYSLLFPIKDVEENCVVFRDYVEGIQKETRQREAMLLPWQYTSFINESFMQKEPESSYFLEGHIEETLPDESVCPPLIDANRPLKVYSEYSFIRDYLNDPAFEITLSEEDADIFWYTKHFKGYQEFSQTAPNKFINQFPFENVITIKDLLSIVCRRGLSSDLPAVDSTTLMTNPKWLPTTYNLKTELIEFVSYYQNRKNKGLDNHWIIKPWNLARSLDTYITTDINQIIRLTQTGPKIAQKYIEKPVLFHRPEVQGSVKFDIRYVILLKDAETVDAYIYTNFFLRFANKVFALNNYDDYEQHFTVMNYSENFELRHIKCEDFVVQWSEQYPEHDWKEIEQNICTMLKQMLVGATAKKPPCGIGNSSQSRALYAADIMLEWDQNQMQPKLLEINWTPDCKRACEYYPDFYNDIFKLLFLDQYNTDVFKKL